MKDLSHSAPFHSGEKMEPLKPGAMHFGLTQAQLAQFQHTFPHEAGTAT
ncbi:hypothetical protein HMPREF9371_0048 [Neisseria shayeganii 871]|uniref:Uncharacterized protein n=1 Tax=Neisseria shayeganii 871 TaxID=1032488 RepID=G4CEK9_9NEIS|nr:hypothetical protein HMPREF9371_0048 [Neisseria shayeganii 871]